MPRSRFVGLGNKPSVVDEDFTVALKNAEENDGLITICEDVLQPGQEVEILTGPMTGTIAEFIHLDAGNRITVLLNMLGNFVCG